MQELRSGVYQSACHHCELKCREHVREPNAVYEFVAATRKFSIYEYLWKFFAFSMGGLLLKLHKMVI
jgi:aldehyde:ferredoxin oxidoreductase